MKATCRLGVIAVVAALVGCGSGGNTAASGGAKGDAGAYFDVTVFRVAEGTITSQDGQIRCGTGGTACKGRYAWTAQAVLTATPDEGYTFGTWAGDCQYTGPCVLDTRVSGADKFVNAVFGPNGVVLHGNFSSAATHGQAYFDRLAQLPTSLDCSNAQCHGPTYGGAGIAPSCNACHVKAGWANWQQSCSFCHGLKNDVTKAGYDFALHTAWAAPPDDVSQRLTGASDGAAGAHQKHVNANIPNAVRGPIACSECHVVPETAIHTLNYALDIPFGPLSHSQGAQPTWDAATLTCGTNYCHGSFSYGSVQGTNSSLAWTGALNGCETCHGMPPVGHAFGGTNDPKSCSGCHPDTVLADGTIDLAKGKHINGQKDAAGGGACDSCHWFPNGTRPATGAHLAHYGLTAEQAGTGFGDLETLEDKYPGATPASAPTAYGFGCGNCHPIDMAQHSMGSATGAKVVLFEAIAPSATLKSKNSINAAYDRATQTCSGVYCHSSGQTTPTYRTTPAWTSTAQLTCADCHENPPRYVSGGAGAPTANSHLALDDYNWVVGHVGGIGAFGHADMHGAAGQSEAAITCQTCHFDTTDPSNTGNSGYYWLDTTGNYVIAGYDAAQQGDVNCTACHTGAGDAVAKAGKVLPLRHVNGRRDVVFDSRTAIDPLISYLPPAPNTPTKPYFRTNDTTYVWLNAVVNGTTTSFSLQPNSTYDPASKTCTVACHNMGAYPDKPTWGAPFAWDCRYCHGDKYCGYYGNCL